MDGCQGVKPVWRGTGDGRGGPTLTNLKPDLIAGNTIGGLSPGLSELGMGSLLETM